MYVVIDEGNTLTRVAKGDEEGLHDVLILSKGEKLPGNFWETPVRKALYCSVAKNADPVLEADVRAHTALMFLATDTAVPLLNRYETPLTLGYDRLADAVGAWSLFPGQNTLVADLGTCINYEMVTAAGEYLGGAISPGMQMRYKAMHTFTGKLPLITEISEMPGLTGRNTIDSMRSGVRNGIAREIDGMIESYSARYPQLNVIITGGDLPYFGKSLKNKTFARPNLVLTGLLEILRYNDGK